MIDLLFVLTTLLLGVLAHFYVRGCAALLPEDRDER
jgi:hypothetical protein